MRVTNDEGPGRDQLALSLSDRRRRPSRSTTKRRAFKTVGLFAGVGGLELGLQRAGHQAALLCEIDRSARAVLDARFPDVPKHDDITTLERLPRGTKLLVAGFPCQDLSQAGKTAGISGARSGLVGHVFRLLEQHEVPWVVLENVPFMLHLAGGRAMNVLVTEFERLGYRWAYRVVDSQAFGLPQRRQRVYFVASRSEDPRRVLFADEAGEPERPRANGDVAYGFYWTEGVRGLGWAVDAVPTLKGGSTVGVPSPPAILMPSGEVVKPHIRDAERMQGFPKDWTKPAEGVDRASLRWKLVGNAVSVPAAKWLGDRLARPAEFELSSRRPLPPGSKWPGAAWNVGDGRFAAGLSMWPTVRQRRSLVEFLKEAPEPLSERATSGFLKRARSDKTKLNFPDGFLEALEAHRERVRAT